MKQRLLFYNALIRYLLHYVNTIWTSCDKKNLGRVSVFLVNTNFPTSTFRLHFARHHQGRENYGLPKTIQTALVWIE